MAIRQVSNNGMGIGDGMMFATDGGPMVSGTWVHQKTGEIITVRDCMFEDNQLIVMTTSGKALSYNQMQDYVQCRDAKEAESMSAAIRKPLGNLNDSKTLPPEVLHEIGEMPVAEEREFVDDITGLGGFRPESFPPKDIPMRPLDLTALKDPDHEIIRRAIGDWSPKIKVSVDGSNIPTEKIAALVDMFGISKEKIVEYVIDNLDRSGLQVALEEKLREIFIEKRTEVKVPLTTKTTSKSKAKKD